MSAEIKNTIDKDFLFQQKLYQGLGDDQYEVRERFEENEQKIIDLESAQSVSGQVSAALIGRVGTLETEQGKIKIEQSNQANALGEFREHVGDADIHVSELIRNHPGNAAVHVPAGGIEGDILARNAAGNSEWRAIMDLLPEDLQDIINNGGNVTPEQLIDAFRTTTVAVWTSAGMPFGASRIKASLWAGDRFLIGASNGQVTHTFSAGRWEAVTTLFPEPYAAAVESISYATATGGETPCVALDAYSDFCISLDRATWSPRLSVRVEKNADGTYRDRYSTNDFTCTIADRGLFLLFTTTGEVYRATYREVVDEYDRVTKTLDADRHSTVWKLQESNFSITQGVLDAASGGGVYMTVGSMGRMSISEAATIWEAVTNPFGAYNINGIAAGDDRFVAVADNGLIGYALYTAPRQWTLIGSNPFGTESVRAVTYGNGVWIAVSASGKVMYSRNGITWTEVPANMTTGGTTLAFGDTYFIVGDTAGNIVRSQSVASMFAVVTRSEFAAFTQEMLHWSEAESAKLLAFVDEQLARINEALSKQLVIGNAPGKPSTLGGSAGTLEMPKSDENGDPILDDDGNPVMVPQNKVPAIDHRHDNGNLTLLSQIGRPSYKGPTYPDNDPVHRQGLPYLDEFGKILKDFNTWMRAEPNGLAPLDENKLIPEEYLKAGWMYHSLIYALRDQMLTSWTIQPTKIFQDLGDHSRINTISSGKTTIVAVGEKGKIAWGPRLDQMQMVADSPFGPDDSLVGVAHGTRPNGSEIFVTISQSQYSTSENGSDWTEALDLSGELQGVFFGGGFFLIPDAGGNIWRSDWDGEGELTFLQQETSPIVTRGVLSIAYLENKWVGVGAGNKIVGSTDPAYWNEEQSPLPADTQLNSVCAGNGFFVTVGNYGRMTKGTVGGSWTEIEQTATGKDLHYVLYESHTYLSAGKDGTLISSGEADSWVFRDSKTTSTIRSIDYQNERFFVGTDSGQFIASASVSDVLWVDTGDGTGPSNEIPNPVGEGGPGIKNTYMRSDAVIPDTGIVLEKRVGQPTTYKSDGSVDRYGVPPLGKDGIVPKPFLPPLEVNVEQIVQYLTEGKQLEFLNTYSPFLKGPGVSTILHDAAYGKINDSEIYVLVGESGIGWSANATQWQLSTSQPFGDVPVVGVEFGEDDLQQSIFVSIDTNRRYSVSRTGKDDWSEAVELDGDYDFEAIAYYNRTFLILCSNGVILRSVFEDGDLIGWDEQADSPNLTDRLNKIVGGNDLYFAVGNEGRIRVSSDASHFAAADSPTTEDLLSACFGKGKFLFGGTNNTLLIGSNTDDIELAAVKPFGGTAAITGLGYSEDDGIYIATNENGEIATSSDLEEWKRHHSPSTVRIKAIAAGASRVILGDDLGDIIVSNVSIEIIVPGPDLSDYATKEYVDEEIANALDGSGVPSGGGGNVTLGVIISVEDGVGTGQKIDGDKQPIGDEVTGLVMIF